MISVHPVGCTVNVPNFIVSDALQLLVYTDTPPTFSPSLTLNASLEVGTPVWTKLILPSSRSFRENKLMALQDQRIQLCCFLPFCTLFVLLYSDHGT